MYVWCNDLYTVNVFDAFLPFFTSTNYYTNCKMLCLVTIVTKSTNVFRDETLTQIVMIIDPGP